MTRLQQVLLELDADYAGHPYYVTGRAVYAAIARRVDAETAAALAVSHGILMPGEWGRFPEAHSQSGGGHFGLKLQPVEAYADLFLYRDPAQRWLLDKRPRDAHNTHPVHSHGGRHTIGAQRVFGRAPDSGFDKRTVSWYVQCYLTAPDRSGVLPLADDVLDGLRVGGARNYGLGHTGLVETQVIDLDALDYSALRAADAYVIEVVTPYVLRTEHPAGDDQDIPWWWGAPMRTAAAGRGCTADGAAERRDAVGGRTNSDGLRRRAERFVVDGEGFRVVTVDHGQVVRYTGDRPIETAKNGVLRVGTHAKFGFGELRVWPGDQDRVPERAATGITGSHGEAGDD